MKSPDRDAADEMTHYSLDAHTETLRTPKGWVHVRHVENGSVGSQREAVEWLASELATLRRRVAEMEASETNRIHELQAALALYRTCAAEAFAFIDEDKEMKAMKLLRAMAGELPRYRHDIDKALAAATFLSPPTRKE